MRLRFITDFVDIPPDVVFEALPEEIREVRAGERLKAQFYVVKLHEMTLKDALTRFPVRPSPSLIECKG